MINNPAFNDNTLITRLARIGTFIDHSIFDNLPTVICDRDVEQFFGMPCTASSTRTANPGHRLDPGAGNGHFRRNKKSSRRWNHHFRKKIGDDQLHPALDGKRIDEIPEELLHKIEVQINPIDPIQGSNFPQVTMDLSSSLKKILHITSWSRIKFILWTSMQVTL